MYILNDKGIPTQIDPYTGKGSTLELGVVSINSKNLITNFEVDTKRNWSPFGIKPVPGGSFKKKFSDRLGIKIELEITKIVKKKMKKREIINYRNEEGWK